jgi:hypothetical protein
MQIMKAEIIRSAFFMEALLYDAQRPRLYVGRTALVVLLGTVVE